MKLNQILTTLSTLTIILTFFYSTVSASPQEIQVDTAITLGSSDKISNFLGIQGTGCLDISNPDPWVVQAWRDLELNVSEICLFGASVTRNTQRKLEYDFTGFDSQLDFLTQTLGIKHINFAIELMPQALSSNPDHELCAFFVPADYREWEEAVYRVVLHLKEKGFVGAHYQVWSEAETYACFRGKPQRKDNDREILDDYVELYIHSWKAVKKADPNAKIGGPMGTQSNAISCTYGGHSWGVEDFFAELAKYNKKNPTMKVTLDEVVWQDYDLFDDATLTDGVNAIRSSLKANGFSPDTPQYLVGWNTGYSDQLEGGKTLNQRAAYIVSMIVEQLNLGDQGLNRAYLWPFDRDDQFPNIALIEVPRPELTLGGEPGTQEGDFYGPRKTYPAITEYSKRPAYAGLQMLAGMKGGELIKTSANTLSKGIHLLATRQKDRIIFLAANNSANSQQISVNFSNLPYPTGSINCLLKRVDPKHSADGKGLEAGSKISLEVKNNKLSLPLEMPSYSIAQINLEP